VAAERVTRQRSRHAADREVGGLAAVLAAGSKKAAPHRLGLSYLTVKHHLANARSKVGATTVGCPGCRATDGAPGRLPYGLGGAPG
jgi:hypothetical protein